ncbi:homeobox-containing protein 1-like [Branchiostoma floridae]|uniref:Homeobox-containing protein 1-like n=1 Tax=Branchiostoma floridae TaxID=7739 RepID=A0A9J7KRM5_BRAFL|nr:homeobox-containing protein 1-like [Branchiostoma floridae]
MEPRFTLEQFNLLTRLMAIGERLQQTGLSQNNMFQALYTMQQSYRLGKKMPALGTGSQPTVTHAQLILLTRQLSIHQSLYQTGLSEGSVFHIISTMQQNKTENTDVDGLQKIEKVEAEYKTEERLDAEVIPSMGTSPGPIAEEEFHREVDRLMREDTNDLNAEIKTFLINHGIRQEAVATEIGVSNSSVSVFLKHGRGLNGGKRRAIYTWYTRQKHIATGMAENNPIQQRRLKRPLDLKLDNPVNSEDHKQSRVRLKWPSAVTMILETYFRTDTNPTENKREELARVCNDELQKSGDEFPDGQLMTPAHVQTWFMDRWLQEMRKHQQTLSLQVEGQLQTLGKD